MAQERPLSGAVERLSSLAALRAALGRASVGRRALPGVAAFLMDAEPRLRSLQASLRAPEGSEGAWRPSPGVVRHILDPKPRVITVVPFVDRVVHQALMAEVEPELERFAVHHSYACRVGKGQHRALRTAHRFAHGHPWALKLDVARYFASIPHDRLVALVHRRVRDRGAARLLEQVIRAPSPGLPPGVGIPVGSLVSQHMANLYLGVLDHHVKDDLGHGPYLRYMDDMLLFGDREALLGRRAHLEAWLPERLGLGWNVRVSRLQPVRDGVCFLGWRLDGRSIRPRSVAWRRWRRRAVGAWRALGAGYVSEAAAASTLSSITAHLRPFDTLAQRRALVRVTSGGSSESAPRLQRLQPRQPWRFLERPTRERAGGEPEQERARQPQEQPWGSPRELTPSSEARRPRLPGLHRGE